MIEDIMADEEYGSEEEELAEGEEGSAKIKKGVKYREKEEEYDFMW